MRVVQHLTVFALLLSTVSCSKNNPTGPSGGSGACALANGSMSATIDGVSWCASNVIVAVYGNSTLAISGNDGTLGKTTWNTVGVGVFANGPGTHNLVANSGAGSNLNFSVFLTTTPNVTAWTASPGSPGSGTLTLTTLTANRATGTFSFTAIGPGGVGTKVVSNGVFNVTY